MKKVQLTIKQLVTRTCEIHFSDDFDISDFRKIEQNDDLKDHVLSHNNEYIDNWYNVKMSPIEVVDAVVTELNVGEPYREDPDDCFY